MKNNWIWILIGIFALVFFVSVFSFAMLLGGEPPQLLGNVAVIPITGEITTSSSSGFFAEGGASSSDIIELLRKADSDANIKAVLLEINSPGGGPVASEEIVNEIKRVKQNKLVVALIREDGASGAYWIASAADHIVASPMSITGSVGVLGSYLEFSGLMDKYGVEYTQLTSGEYKDIGAPFRELTPKERVLMQKKLDIIHDRFLNDVKKNRNLTSAQTIEISSGIFFLGEEALELNLVDELGDKDAAMRYIADTLGTEVTEVPYQVHRGFFESLAAVSRENSYMLGLGIGNGLSQNFKIKV